MKQTRFLRAHQFAGLEPGPRLIVLGAVHGNETCGTRAIERLVAELEEGRITVERGLLTLVPITNPLAFHLRQRQGDRNLNRNLRKTSEPLEYEDRIANVLCPWLEGHDVLLDLHSFHTAGEPFTLVGPENNDGTLEPFKHAEAEAQMAAHLGPRRIVNGWMETYARGVSRRKTRQPGLNAGLYDTRYGVGTTEYMRAHGGYGVTLECGQHEDPAAPDVGYRAVCQTLALLKMAPLTLEPATTGLQRLRLVDVVDREHEGDRFIRPWASFDPVTKGQPVGHRHGGDAVLAPTDGFVVFPNPGAIPGNEWFYFAELADGRR